MGGAPGGCDEGRREAENSQDSGESTVVRKQREDERVAAVVFRVAPDRPLHQLNTSSECRCCKSRRGWGGEMVDMGLSSEIVIVVCCRTPKLGPRVAPPLPSSSRGDTGGPQGCLSPCLVSTSGTLTPRATQGEGIPPQHLEDSATRTTMVQTWRRIRMRP